MAIQSVLDAREKAELSRIVQDHNSKINNGKSHQEGLGKDDFLKILITQLSYQDPTAPMEDKEFIAQMAQFSSLEQMTSMAGDFAKLTRMITGSEAASALGRSVEISDGETSIQGSVKAVSRGQVPEILVNGSYYPWDKVTRIYEE
jgi:flagellar basal-body rod modification protein FlgD